MGTQILDMNTPGPVPKTTLEPNEASFDELGMAVVKDFISPEALPIFLQYLKAAKLRYAKARGVDPELLENDEHHPHTFSYYSPLCAEVLLLNKLGLVEKVVRRRLVPSYSYARTYYRGSELEKHTDRKCSHVGISVCLEKDEFDWPLFITDKCGRWRQIVLEPGEAVIFSGMQLEHYREVFTGRFQTQIFLFFVPEDDTLSQFYFDQRSSLGRRSVQKTTMR